MRDVALAVEIRKGVITVPRLKAILPGDMVLQANTAAAPPIAPAATCRQACRCARQPIPSNRPASSASWGRACARRWRGSRSTHRACPRTSSRRCRSRARSPRRPNSVQVSDLAIDLDGQRATGSGSVTFGLPCHGGDVGAARPLRPRCLHAAARRAIVAAGCRAGGDHVAAHAACRADSGCRRLLQPRRRTRTCPCSASRPRSPSWSFAARR